MDVSSIAAAASANSAAQVQQDVSLAVLKKAMDTQAEGALALLQALPQPPSTAISTAGGVIDTYA